MTEQLFAFPGVEPAQLGARPMIVADDAHVEYKVFASGKRVTARDNLLSMRALRGGRSLQTVPALRGVTFTATEGETIGVVGHNGSGKSTLFRAMSGLIPTSEGQIWVRDRPVLLGVNAALVPDLSGENNIKLGLLAMGFTPAEAAARVDEIADFAELNEFIHHPMKTYSSGMGARLRFAIASAKAHSILLIDEALAVGDRRFKVKSEKRIAELRETAGLVMIVSHSTGSLKDTCERVLWIHKGELRADGPADAVIDDYVRWTKDPGSTSVGAASAAKPKQQPKPAAKPAVPVAAAAAVKPEPAPKPPVVQEGPGSIARPIPGLVDPAAATAAPAAAAPAELSLFDQLLATASTPTTTTGKAPRKPRRTKDRPSRRVAVATTPITLPRESPRDAVRRERYQRVSRERTHRRVVTMVVTGIAILLAIGAGAAIALTAVLSAKAGGAPLKGPPAAALTELPVIASFSASTPSAICAGADGEGIVKLSWDVAHSAQLAVAVGTDQVDALATPLRDSLPSHATEYELPFPCASETQSYTLTAAGAEGSRVSSVVKVDRALATPSPAPTTKVTAPRNDSRGGTVVAPPPAQVPTQPTAPAQEPSPAPEPSLPTEPSPAPEPSPPDPDPSPAPAVPPPTVPPIP